MSIKKKIKAIIRRCDMFKQPVTFRYNDEPQFETLTGGCVSVLIIIAFIGIFSQTLLNTVQKEYINFNESKHDEPSPSYFTTTLGKTFMFAVGFDNIDMNSGDRYFDVIMEYRYYTAAARTKTSIPLIKCTLEQWQSRGYEDSFNRLNLTRWMCPPEGTGLQLQGKFTSVDFKFYKITVKKCSTALNPLRPCASNTTIETYLNQNQAFNFNYYFINTIINPGDHEYLTSYLEDVNYFPFNPVNGVNANLFISSYTIQTDQSLWPTEEIETDEGGIVAQPAQVMNYQVRGTEYVKLYLRKSPISITIFRSFKKIDDTLSYIGGLFSTIFVLFVIFNQYNEIAFELELIRSTYYFDKNDPYDANQFNFFFFLGYLVFCFFDMIGIKLNWPRYQRFDRLIEEGKTHLDIRLILKKIVYAEKLGLTILDKKKHKALLLSEPFTLNEADEIKKDLKFFKSFRKKFFPNGESVQENESLLRCSLSKTDVQQGYGVMVFPMVGSRNGIESGNGDSGMVYQPTSTQLIDYDKSTQKKKQPCVLKNEQQFMQLDSDMKQCLQQLQKEAENGDELAKKVLQKIDSRIKRRYLDGRRILNPLKVISKIRVQTNFSQQI